jgi:hypothetical protein
MAHAYYCPFTNYSGDLHIQRTMERYQYLGYTLITTASPRIASDVELHIVGHGSELDPQAITLTPDSKGKTTAVALNQTIRGVTGTDHRLITLDMCFGFGNYATSSGQWIGIKHKFTNELTYFAKELSEALIDYRNLRIKGSACPVVYVLADARLKTAHDTGSKNLPGYGTQILYGKSKVVFDRIFYEIDHQGKIYDADGQEIPRPRNLW